jgi:DNA-binding transcriptional ArsR family regulator
MGKQSDNVDKVFHALSDPSRRKMVDLLREAGTLRVTDLAKAFDMSLNGVSKHVKVLEEAGVVKRKIEWREHFLEINWSALQGPYDWLHARHHYWSKRVDALIGYVVKNRKEKK